ncbi:MAG: glycine--tRNA ligase subunit beta [Bryobacterales bacterium]|nr:glycine--tRNA ligase subunit beta [Bryobacterales bacterium]
MLPFLLEIGTEEIPDWMIPGALEHLESRFRELLEKNRLAHEPLQLDATPRRLVLRCPGIQPAQESAEALVTGPPVTAAYKNGEPTPAAHAFAKKMGTDLASLRREQTPKGEYLAYLQRTEGRATGEILAEALPELVLGTYFPKAMMWAGKGTSRFIRPIRWLVALLGDAVVPFAIEGVASGNTTEGHRRLGKPGLVVTHASYEQTLRDNGVLLSAAERRARITEGAAALAAAHGLSVATDERLLETLVYITECPTPILGAFAEEYLTLPEEVLVTVMRYHQKYFALHRADGSLAPNFIAVMNTSADPDGLVRSGNERVLRARFNDARFFWDVDQKRTLADRVDSLAAVTFQAKLGNYLEKAQRVAKRAKFIAQPLGLDPGLIERAALLSKCDLTTELVKEFTELQGVVGGLYAEYQGESIEVSQAIYYQYRPVSMEDEIPPTLLGQVISLADRSDTLAKCFEIGLIPKGSSDPFALRRSAQGVVKILAEGDAALGGIRLGDMCFGWGSPLFDFFRERIRHYLREHRVFAYDEVSAVLNQAGNAELVNIQELIQRLSALQDVRKSDDFEPIAASFKRIKNILRQAEFAGGVVSEPLLVEEAERALYGAFTKVRADVHLQRAAGDYSGALEAIASLRPAVDGFFDQVLVNASDEQVRRNRLSLLHELMTELSAIADFSEIVTK